MQPSIHHVSIEEGSTQQALTSAGDSAQLDALIAKVKGGGDSELLVEHLQTAHAYLQGAMPEECVHNLEMASEAAAALSARSLAGEVRQTVAAVLHDLHPFPPAHWRHHAGSRAHGPSATAEGLAEFFHGAELSLGILYPKKHVIAVFGSYIPAQSARVVLSAAGLRPGEVIAVPGAEMQQFIEDARQHQSLWGGLMMRVSRVLDTEAGLVDRYSIWARRGAAFLVAYSPTQAQAEEISDLLKPLYPVAVHWFATGYIRRLI